MLKAIDGLEDLINSEGPILRLLTERNSIPGKDDLYVECGCRKKNESVICKTNQEILMLYLNGRLRTEELFTIRRDEGFIIKTEQGYERRSYSTEFKCNYIDDLKFGDFFYSELSADLKTRQDILTICLILKDYDCI